METSKMTTYNKRTKVLDFYMSFYPNDEEGKNINPNLTFTSLLRGMKKGLDFYEMVGVGDSIIRERIFVALADLYANNDYGAIYSLWMFGADNVSRISNLCGNKTMKCSF
jgi:hypothetical protein